MEIAYCWKCKRDVALFDEVEWARLVPRLEDGLEAVKSYRSQHEVALGDAPVALKLTHSPL